MDKLITNIDKFIITAREKGMTNSVIAETLRTNKWPDDIIQRALQNADKVVPEVQEQQKNIEDQQPKIEANAVPQQTLSAQPQDNQVDKQVQPKKFSILSILALLLSPLPFIGMGVAMLALEQATKKDLAGKGFALLALLINFLIILGIIWVIYQILTLDYHQLTGLSKFVAELWGW